MLGSGTRFQWVVFLAAAGLLLPPIPARGQLDKPIELKIPFKELARFPADTPNANAAVFSTDSRFVFVACYNAVVVFRVPDGSLVGWRRPPEGFPAAVIYHMQLMEGGSKVIAQHWNSYATSVWDVASMCAGRDSEPLPTVTLPALRLGND